MKKKTFTYNSNLRKSWLVGKLPRKWKADYPELFDEDDLRIALTQPHYHFIEWLAAIYYFKKGYKALVEQYIYKPHQRKIKIIKEYLGQEGFDFLRKKGLKGKAQPPDLFVYKQKHYFFAEVKSPRDMLHDEQRIFFREIEKHLNTEVIILQAQESKL